MELETMPHCDVKHDVPRAPPENNGLSPPDDIADTSRCRARKNKPPNLNIAGNSPHVDCNHETDEEQGKRTTPLPEISPSDRSSYVILRKQKISTLDAGATLNSPLIKRASRLDQILEIPDVAAALVRDEGYEMLMHARRMSIERAASRRQQTPVPTLEEKRRFLFEESSQATGDIDSESTSGSDSSSLLSSTDSGKSTTVASGNRRRIEPLKIGAAKLSDPHEVFKLISDNRRASFTFTSPVEEKPPSGAGKHKKRRNKQSSDDTSDGVSPSGEAESSKGSKKRFLFRLKSSMNRSSSNMSLYGWQSLARALARVGVDTSALWGADLDPADVNPTVTPILKRRVRQERLCSDDTADSPKDPGTKPALRKKTVSFSRLPSEASVKNSADCIALMQNGHQFVKMRSNSRVYNRLYWLDETLNCLRWEPSKKDSGKARIEVTCIREVRAGKTTELFLSSDISTHFPDECSFSIIHGDGKTLDLIANSADDANVWVTGLRCLMSGQDLEGLRLRADARDTWLSKMFDDADINGDGYLDSEESLTLITSLSDGIRELRIKQKLQEHVQLRDSEDRSRLSRDEFIEIFKDVATRPEIYFLLARFANRDDRLSVDDLTLFLEAEQGITDVTYETCAELIETYEPSESLKNIPALGIDGFTKYLMSDECGVFDSRHTEVCQDMTQPLSHYFIASSHNTYLMEDQLAGPSSANAYVRALLRCCRCVELDCWDGVEGEPVVTHGHTNINTIPFRQVIEAISESAFRNSVYPVILSIENHCSEEQQRIMANDLVDVLGDRIYRKDLPDPNAPLPSPAALKERFLIRSKKLPPGGDGESGYVTEEDEGWEVKDAVAHSPRILDSPTSPRINDHAERRQILVKEFSDLVSICSCVRLRDDLEAHLQNHRSCHTSSVHEQTAARLVEDFPDEFAIHNKKFLTRVYPSGVRCDSSNFNPQDYWNCGVQIASLNYQTPGLMMDINDGRFSMNGGCGYVLKPSVMRDTHAYYSTNHSEAIPGVSTKILTLRIISGQNFPKPRGGGAKGHVIDPYVLIELFGVPADCAEQRTRTAPNNSGESPLFDESFEFRLTLPSLALVRFVVLDDEFIGDEFIGQYTIPFECMRPGYRHLRLRSIFDEPLDDASLFVHISFTDTEPVVVSMSGTIVSSQPTQAGGTLKKRGSAQKRLKKARSRKDIDVLALRDVGIAKIDDIFRNADTTLRHASTLRDAQRWSLSYLREACGAAPLASVKQCVRALGRKYRTDTNASDGMRSKRAWSAVTEGEMLSHAETNDAARSAEQRPRTVSADLMSSRLRRQPSETSQSSSDSSASQHSVSLLRQERRLLLELRGHYSTSEYWRKSGLAMDAFVSDTLAILDNAPVCEESLASICKNAESMFADIPKLLGVHTTSGGHDGPEAAAVANGSNQGKKVGKTSSRKKMTTYSDGERRKRQSAEENFRWNYSVIKGQHNLLQDYHKNADRHLADLWQAGVQCGLTQTRDPARIGSDARPVNGLESSPARGGNRNGNNNAGDRPMMTATQNGTKSLFSVAKHSLSPFQRSKSAPTPALSKQSRTSDITAPVTPL